MVSLFLVGLPGMLAALTVRRPTGGGGGVGDGGGGEGESGRKWREKTWVCLCLLV